MKNRKADTKINYESFFTKWKSWEDFEERVDGINGVYAFRLKSKFSRLKEKSKVIYIGMCNQDSRVNKRSGIWHRLMNYRQRNRGASKRLKEIETAFGGRGNIEYAYEVCDNPRVLEKDLLNNYYQKHLEFPPLNRSG